MNRLSPFNSPFFLGFDHFEQLVDRVTKASSDGYPPYNIERVGEDGLRITLAPCAGSPSAHIMRSLQSETTGRYWT